ncbi:MAG: GNAT family N-acetyltransferase [Hydrococcus sp. Prado102]|jgi:putative acetyltransferase|nr:GNAT family N-acetyltransferase [Hydrococcus sp. Prado102]
MSEDEQQNQGDNFSKTQLFVTIRLTKPDEINTLLQLQTKSLRILTAKDYDRRQIEAIIERNYRLNQFRMGAITFVAEYEGKIIGFAILNRIFRIIDAVFVHPDFVRRSVGKQLMFAIEQEAIQRKIKSLLVLSSLTAINFYQALGYQILGETTISHNKIKIPCVYMKKQFLPFTLIDRLYGWIIIVLSCAAIARFLYLVLSLSH